MRTMRVSGPVAVAVPLLCSWAVMGAGFMCSLNAEQLLAFNAFMTVANTLSATACVLAFRDLRLKGAGYTSHTAAQPDLIIPRSPHSTCHHATSSGTVPG